MINFYKTIHVIDILFFDNTKRIIFQKYVAGTKKYFSNNKFSLYPVGTSSPLYWSKSKSASESISLFIQVIRFLTIMNKKKGIESDRSKKNLDWQ